MTTHADLQRMFRQMTGHTQHAERRRDTLDADVERVAAGYQTSRVKFYKMMR